MADPELLHQAIANLTGNAAKYNREGGSVSLDLTTDGDCAQLTVANDGPSISADDQVQLFDRFYRADRARKAGGVGLGLSIAREIARAHGGDVALVESADDLTTFRLTLPLAP